ncbi:MAG: molybdate ABC transporter substrate-binding protein [Roseicyclus sp.]|nr:molybdate ABC transporter substrate-binding protein [Roseicyclus sp.]MBO6625273.1 molybdate ABC transporter substrate-binding protein [Roseicyclus sp.]MBO6922516.1 molybdate ABC transporter substrate-binding protein [Roseicyclus sp.]
MSTRSQPSSRLHPRAFSSRLLPALAALFLSLAPFGGVSQARADTILIFAAASLREALDEVAAVWTGAPLSVSYAGSSALARQIEAGAPADLFLSANMAWIAHLAERGISAPERTIALLANRLVLAGPADAVHPVEDLAAALAALPGDARIATGFLEAVPAGIYARQALEASDLLEDLMPRIVQTENVRIALALAARGEVARAIVYRTDALAEPGVAIEVLIPKTLHDPIRYPAALMTASTHPEAAAFLAFLTSPQAMAIFRSHGFEVPE